MSILDDEIEIASRAILAAEDWAPSYATAPDEHAKLIRLTAKLERDIMVYFRNLAKQTNNLVNWWYYHAQRIQAYNIQVMINEDAVSAADQQFLKIVFDPIAKIQSLGSDAADTTYNEGITLTPTSSIIHDLTTDQVGALIGKSTNAAGRLVNNPNAAMNIDDTTRDLINNAIKKSLNLGYSQDEAQDAVSEYIADPARASMIARTESVRAYNIGQYAYAKQAGYQGKYWTTAGATDYCLDNEAEGTIPIGQDFASGASYPPAHPNCRCGVGYAVNLGSASS